MSREVRRVPLDYKHPTVHNLYWEHQASSPYGRGRPASRLHGPTERFVGLMGDYPGSLADWQRDLAEVRARTGHSWTFAVEYHLTGFQGHDDSEPVVHPYYDRADPDGEPVTVRDEDHLHALDVARLEDERPDPADYMPVFDIPEDDLGWCLYETVSEGTPTTPVFTTADELIDHLATIGQDWDQVPMRRAAAESLVRSGWSLGSFVVAGGSLYDSAKDADLITERLGLDAAS